VLETLEKASRPLTRWEIALPFSCIVAENLIMMAIRHLLVEGRLIQLPDGRIRLAGRVQHFEPAPRPKKVKRIVPKLYPELF